MQIGSLIRRAALYRGDAPCLVEGERIVSFREFDVLTDCLGNALCDAGLKPGDRVGVLLPNGINCLIAYYALAKAGLVRVSLNTRETAEDHRFKLTDSGCRGVIFGDAESVVDLEFRFDARTTAAMTESGRTTPCQVDRGLDDPLRLGYTGGTTGTPKAVVLTTRGELSELSAFLMDLLPDMGTKDVFLHAAPIAHASGAFFLPAIVRGTKSIVMQKFDSAAFLKLAEGEQATMTFLVPTMLSILLEHPGQEN